MIPPSRPSRPSPPPPSSSPSSTSSSRLPPAKRPRHRASPERLEKSEPGIKNEVVPAPNAHLMAQAQAFRRYRIASISNAVSRWTPMFPQLVSTQLSYPSAPPESPFTSRPACAAQVTKISDTSKSKSENADGKVPRNPTTILALKEQLRAQATPPQSSQHMQSPSAGEVEVLLDKYQAAAVEAAKRGDSFFLTGSAGVGKSFVLRQIISQLRADSKSVAVTASTGCAAVAIQGCTIHSFLGLGLGMESESTLRRRALTSDRVKKRLGKLDVLVIDEISMIDCFLFDKIEIMCTYGRLTEENVGQGDERYMKNVPLFGGLQIIVCGDFFQLPPVSCSDYRHQFVKEKFFAFEAKAWKRGIKMTCCLHEVHRQSDKVFVGMLNELRRGLVSTATRYVLNACCVVRDAAPVEVDDKGIEIHYTKLYPYRNQVNRENITRLNAIPAQGVRYLAKDTVSSDLGNLNKKTVQTLLDNVSGLNSFTVKKSCRVLCVKNIDQDMGIVNGSAGIVTGFKLTDKARLQQLEKFKFMTEETLTERIDEMTKDGLLPEEQIDLDQNDEDGIVARLLKELPRDEDGFLLMSAQKPQLVPVVKFDDGQRLSMVEEKWTVHGLDGKVVGNRVQIPLTLGWALSIHKAQGMTLLNVETDVGKCFDYGQVYVALSRATSLRGLRLISFNASKVITHHKVKTFHETVENEGPNDSDIARKADVKVKIENVENSDEFVVSDRELLMLTNCDEWWNKQGAAHRSKIECLQPTVPP